MKILIAIILGMFATIANCQTIHWLVFVDTNDNIGHLSMISRKLLFHDFIDVTNAHLSEKGISIDMHDIWGESLSPNMCKEVISNLKCESNDVVVFYYIGHGYNTAENNSLFPLMNIGSSNIGESIPLSWVHESIKKLNPRLLITIGMCDNILYETLSPGQSARLSDSGGIHRHEFTISKEEDSISGLFMNYKGDIIVTSSSLGHPSFGNTGGDYFTNALVSVFDEMQNIDKLNWYGLLNEVRHRVEFITKEQQVPTWKCNLTRLQYGQEKDVSDICKTYAEMTARRFWENLSLYCKTGDDEYRVKVEEECYARCRVRDSLMTKLAEQHDYPKMSSYMLESCMNCLEKEIINSPVEITIGDIREIYNQENLCIVSCHIKISGAINAEFTDLLYVREGMITSIINKATN